MKIEDNKMSITLQSVGQRVANCVNARVSV